ncbi:hypothetical protein [Fodinibius halophilus]|uniref:Helix-turn-helix domain-containing protein n=1 Tax=Fodinibius halophilus TaxID=1736908 RepID=A0A6M1THG8_9BACT|nr:hypothetical protein [Fodinibius halophilus]NGP90174.1 hypothetical protein [Fodinibius halophilus]
MSITYITSEEKLKEAVAEAVASILDEELPSIIRKSQRSEYLTTKELKQLVGWSYRSQKHLRDTSQLTYCQHGRKIVYPTEAIEKFLSDHKIQSKNSKE